jgi:hypothetical protein
VPAMYVVLAATRSKPVAADKPHLVEAPAAD